MFGRTAFFRKNVEKDSKNVEKDRTFQNSFWGSWLRGRLLLKGPPWGAHGALALHRKHMVNIGLALTEPPSTVPQQPIQDPGRHNAKRPALRQKTPMTPNTPEAHVRP